MSVEERRDRCVSRLSSSKIDDEPVFDLPSSRSLPKHKQKAARHALAVAQHQRLSGGEAQWVCERNMSDVLTKLTAPLPGPRTLCNACGLVYAKLVRHDREDYF